MSVYGQLFLHPTNRVRQEERSTGRDSHITLNSTYFVYYSELGSPSKADLPVVRGPTMIKMIRWSFHLPRLIDLDPVFCVLKLQVEA